MAREHTTVELVSTLVLPIGQVVVRRFSQSISRGFHGPKLCFPQSESWRLIVVVVVVSSRTELYDDDDDVTSFSALDVVEITCCCRRRRGRRRRHGRLRQLSWLPLGAYASIAQQGQGKQ